MTNIESTLLILLSIGFLVWVVIAIAIALIIMKILQNVRRVSEKAELATDNLNQALRVISKKVAPMALSSLMGMAVSKLKKHKKGRD